jgi:hypothetical protein
MVYYVKGKILLVHAMKACKGSRIIQGAAEIVKHFKTLVTRFSTRVSLSTGV